MRIQVALLPTHGVPSLAAQEIPGTSYQLHQPHVEAKSVAAAAAEHCSFSILLTTIRALNQIFVESNG